MRAHIAGILAGWATRSGFDGPGAGGGQPQAGDGAARRGRAGPRWAPRPASSCRGRAARWSWCCPARRGSCRDVARRAGRRAGARAAGRRAGRGVPGAALLRRCPSRRSRPRCASSAHARDLSGVEVTTCLRRSELEVDLRPQPGARGGRRRAARRARRPARAAPDQRRRHQHRRAAGPGLLARGWTVATGESCTGGHARLPAGRPGRVLGVRRGRGGGLLERGQDRAARRAGGA